MKTPEEIKVIVRGEYGRAASQAQQGGSSCCSGVDLMTIDPITGNLYDQIETNGLPPAAVAASLGCGNPTALAELQIGETVLDLGSGGGIDVLLSARRVGSTGRVYGLDMTDEMLALARQNQANAGVTNVEFLKGEIEAIPLPDASVDIIISNCVINLSPEKDRVFAEAYRVLKPRGRLAISDIVVRGAVPAEVRKSMELWAGCVAGALEEGDYRAMLARVGFEAIEIVPTRIYTLEEAKGFLAGAGLEVDAVAQHIQDRFMSAFVRACKPIDPASKGS
jgi:SAM-dependent methyltransferase